MMVRRVANETRSSRRSTLKSSSRMGSELSQGDKRRAPSKAPGKKIFNLIFLPRDAVG
jgi:hypothetical protein